MKARKKVKKKPSLVCLIWIRRVIEEDLISFNYTLLMVINLRISIVRIVFPHIMI